MKQTVITKTENGTVYRGRLLASKLKPGDVVLLSGDLGAGKTHFTKGSAAGLGYTGDVVSPTFTIVCEYRGGRLPLIHMDVYRLGDADELYDIGFGEYLAEGGVTVIEWAEKFPELRTLPARVFAVNIRRRDDVGPGVRELTFEWPEDCGQTGSNTRQSRGAKQPRGRRR